MLNKKKISSNESEHPGRQRRKKKKSASSVFVGERVGWSVDGLMWFSLGLTFPSSV